MHQNKRVLHTDSNKLLDKYYTKLEVVRKCLSVVNDIGHEYDCVVEPSAGDGAFYNEIDHPNKIGLDLEPGCDGVTKQDWLEYRLPSDFKRALIIGNPPFGQYHKLSSRFILHSMSFPNVQTISFILPNVYKKHTRQRILPSHWRIASITDVGKNAFTIGGKECHIPSSFFVFDKSAGEDLRVNPNQYTETDDFTFGDRNDFDIFVFGASPKTVSRNPKPNNRGYFLKSKIPTDELVERIRSVDWNGNSCASGGVFWLTKFEFLDQYVKKYGISKNTLGSQLHFE